MGLTRAIALTLLLIAVAADSNFAQCSTMPVFNSQIDFDCSGAVDHNDLMFLADNWLWSGSAANNPADLIADGAVDFNDFAGFASLWARSSGSVAIFIDSATDANMPDRILRLASDIENDLGTRVFIFCDQWTDIRRIKDIIIDKCNNNGLIGAILIGDIPTAYFEYRNSGSTPSDRYFQDLSDNFIDTDGDGKFEREFYLNETDITMRDIWTGRIKPPVSGDEAMMLLKDYLERNHAYRTGSLTYDRKMLYFGSVAVNQNDISEEEYYAMVDQIDEYTGLYQSDDEVDAIYDGDLARQKADYLAEMSGDRDFLFVNIHGSPTVQWLGGSTYVSYDEIKAARPGALFSVLASCSNGNFTAPNYLAGWHLFSGNSLVLTANSVDTMLLGGTYVEFLRDYIPLGIGATFGDMHKNDLSNHVTHLFGDPTLALRPKPVLNQPKLTLDKTFVDFGTVVQGSKPTDYIRFDNDGLSPVTISFKKAPFSIDGRGVVIGYWDVFYYKRPDTGQMFRTIEIPPGQSKMVPFTFFPRSDGPVGAYSMIMLFQTNDPAYPYIKIRLAGVARVPEIKE